MCLEILLGVMEHVSRMEKSLGRNAANVQTSTAQTPATLNTSSLQAQLSSLDGRDIASRTSAYHHHIVRIYTSPNFQNKINTP